MADLKTEETQKTQIVYQSVEVFRTEFGIRAQLFKDGFQIWGYNEAQHKHIMWKGFVIPKAPEPPRPSCLG
jgi:hypothetical protein